MNKALALIATFISISTFSGFSSLPLVKLENELCKSDGSTIYCKNKTEKFTKSYSLTDLNTLREVKLYKIFDGNYKNITLLSGDADEPKAEQKLESDGVYYIYKKVFLKYADRTDEVLTAKKLVSELDIKTQEYQLSVDSKTEISNNMTIVLGKISTKTVSEYEDIPFLTTQKNDPTILVGQKKETGGSLGRKKIVYKLTFIDGTQTSKEKVSESVVKKPADKVITIGTKQQSQNSSSTQTTQSGKYSYDSNGYVSINDPVWDRLAKCESTNNWSIVSPPYYGGLQFDLSTWKAYGGTGYPSDHTRAEQITIAQKLQKARGWSPWPYCSNKLGL